MPNLLLEYFKPGLAFQGRPRGQIEKREIIKRRFVDSRMIRWRLRLCVLAPVELANMLVVFAGSPKINNN